VSRVKRLASSQTWSFLAGLRVTRIDASTTAERRANANRGCGNDVVWCGVVVSFAVTELALGVSFGGGPGGRGGGSRLTVL
jgi:hypothetical protein